MYIYNKNVYLYCSVLDQIEAQGIKLSDGTVVRVVITHAQDMSYTWKTTLEGSAGGTCPCHLCWRKKTEFGAATDNICGFCEEVRRSLLH